MSVNNNERLYQHSRLPGRGTKNKADKFNNQTFEGKFKRTIYIASNYILSTQKAKGPSQWPGKSSLIFFSRYFV